MHVQVIAEPIALKGWSRVTVGASFGIATAAAGKVAQLADAALYDAKRAKRDAADPPAPES